MLLPVRSFYRRQFLVGLTAAHFFRSGLLRAAPSEVGIVADVVGSCFAKGAKLRRLAKAEGVAIGETIWTEMLSRAALNLNLGGTLHLGPETRVLIDKFVASESGELVLNQGALIFDRSEDLPKTELLLRMQYGQLAVRGTKFFAGPSQGRFSVFVEHGAVIVSNQLGSVTLQAGEGTDFPSLRSAPTAVKKWGEKRIAAAYASVLR